MCGIVGMSLRKGVKAKEDNLDEVTKAFTRMLIKAQIRGSSATGVIASGVDPQTDKPKIYVVRSPLAAEDFVKTEEYTSFLSKIDKNTYSIIGHTRAPSGNPDASPRRNENNHPHIHGAVIGVHNGRVVNDFSIWRALAPEVSSKSACDSEVLFALINYFLEKGNTMEEAISLAAQRIRGWLAIATVNAAEPSMVYLLRDKNTPLEVGFWDWPEVAVFASNYDWIESALKPINNRGVEKLVRYDLNPYQIIGLDSELRGQSFRKMFLRSYSIKVDEKENDKVLKSNEESYKVTQGW